jgi:hypothetical protein
MCICKLCRSDLYEYELRKDLYNLRKELYNEFLNINTSKNTITWQEIEEKFDEKFQESRIITQKLTYEDFLEREKAFIQQTILEVLDETEKIVDDHLIRDIAERTKAILKVIKFDINNLKDKYK